MNEQFLSAREAAERLGVKLDTLYAYVSRGLLHSVVVPGTRQRRYRVPEVDRLLAGRGGERAQEALTPVIDSAICLIESGRFFYRAHDAVELAERATLEDIATLLWGEAPASRTDGAGRVPRPGARIRTTAAGFIERCQIQLTLLGAADLAALDLSSAGVIRSGQRILAALVSSLGGEGGAKMPIHRRLATVWSLDDTGADLIRRCLVLLADHELNASTFVARCVASTGATPYAVVSAALSALSGRRHGGASARAEALFHEIGRAPDPRAAMAARLARDDSLPGLGQPLYPNGDPRARALLAALIAAIPAAESRLTTSAAAARELTGEYPNVDFALAAVTTTLCLPVGAALSLFVIARSVGWIAHAIEQYESRILIRPRARYTGIRQNVY